MHDLISVVNLPSHYGLNSRFDGNSELVAELVAANSFKAAYAIKDGAEGPRGWIVRISCFFKFIQFNSLNLTILLAVDY